MSYSAWLVFYHHSIALGSVGANCAPGPMCFRLVDGTYRIDLHGSVFACLIRGMIMLCWQIERLVP
jgi:hypothetical protein